MPAALVLLTVLVYAPVRHFDFVELDDPGYVTENRQVSAGLTLDGARWAATTGHMANWHPLTWWSLMLDVQLFGVSPGAMHLSNVAYHSLATVLLWIALHGLTNSVWRTTGVALVFALHPLHVESVAWVAERKDVLSACFWMLTLLAYTAYVKQPSRLRLWVTAVVFGVGLMAKPMLVTLPVVLLLIDLWPLNRWTWERPEGLIRLAVEKWPLFLLAAASSVITVVVQAAGGAVASLDARPPAERLGDAFLATVGYLGKMVNPTDLRILYSSDFAPTTMEALGAFAVVAGITAVVWRMRGTSPALVVGWLWYLVTLLPVSGVIQVGIQNMADRYTYIPMIGISIAAAWAIPASWFRGTIARIVAGTAIVGLTVWMVVGTRHQLPVWSNNAALFGHAAAVTLGVDLFTAHLALGEALLRDGKFAGARSHLTEAVALRPNAVGANFALGRAFLDDSQPAQAIPYLAEAVRGAPTDVAKRNDLAVAYVRTDRIDDAINEYRRLLELRPGDETFEELLAILIARKGGLS